MHDLKLSQQPYAIESSSIIKTVDAELISSVSEATLDNEDRYNP
jgi:hypothetical protein